MKDKTTAGLFAIFLGGLGVHKFYLDKAGMGILYLLFCWTLIPALLGIIEGIIYLASSEGEFNAKYNAKAKARGKVAAFKADYEAAKKAEAIGEPTEALKKYKAAKYELEKLPSHTNNKTDRWQEIEDKIIELERNIAMIKAAKE